jgi:hypothetical protein
VLLFQLQQFVLIIARSVNTKPQRISSFRCQAGKKWNRHFVNYPMLDNLHSIPQTQIMYILTFRFLCTVTNAHHGLHHDLHIFPPRINLILDFVAHPPVSDPHTASVLENLSSKHGNFASDSTLWIITNTASGNTHSWDTYDHRSVIII